jgi:tight adherence protein B
LRRLFFLAALGLALLLTITTALADTGGVQIEDVQRGDGKLSFTIYTRGGPLLESEDFEVGVNGLKAKDVVALAKDSVLQPKGAVLLLDSSGSMAGTPIAEAKDAVRTFLEGVEPNDEVALVTFSDEARVLSNFTTDRDEILAQLHNVQATGETALNDGVLKAIQLLGDRPPDKRNIVLLSDGKDTVSDASFQTSLTAAKRAGATVFIVALKSPDYSPGAIAPLASETGGRLLTTTDPSRLSKLFRSLAKRLVSGYEVQATDPDPGASVVELEIDVGQGTVGSGRKIIEFPTDAPADDRAVPAVDDIPLPILLLIVFLGAAGVAFLVVEGALRKRASPLERVKWYDEAAQPAANQEALINAAVLNRAKELATTLADKTGYLERMERAIEAAGMKWRPGEVIVASAGMAVAGLALGFTLSGLLWAFLGTFLGAVGPFAYIKHKASKRTRAFREQLPDVLLLMSGALKAGYSLQQAIGAVGKDVKPPAADEFRRTMAEVRLGAPLDAALQALARRIGIVDFEWTVLAIQIQREVGGNLAEILEIISHTIRERERVHRQIRTLTAEGRLSGWVLGILPFAMALLISLRSPGYLEPLYTTGTGLVMVAIAVFMMIVGAFWMRKIVKIEV